MRSRLAKKIRKRPWRYSSGSVDHAYIQIGLYPRPPITMSKAEWMVLGVDAVDKIKMDRLKEAFRAAFIRELGLPVDVFKGNGSSSGLTATMEQWKGAKP